MIETIRVVKYIIPHGMIANLIALLERHPEARPYKMRLEKQAKREAEQGEKIDSIVVA